MARRNAAGGTDELRQTLTAVLSQHFGAPCRVKRLQRRQSAYASSCPITNLTLTLERGHGLALILKDLSPGASLPTARRVRPHLIYDPRREIETYRSILEPGRWGTPVCYGVVDAPELGRFWLFLERVSGRPLWQVGSLDSWKEAAAWLAKLHGEFASNGPEQHRLAAAHLLEFDRGFFELWIRRAEENVRRSKKEIDTVRRGRFRQLADRYHRVIERLLAMPASFIHGEFYPSNIIIRRAHHGGRVCPVDWELAGIGPRTIDLAALSSGKWSDDSRRGIITAYRETSEPVRGGRPSMSELTEAVEYGQLHLAIQMLGWAPDWAPPAEHSQDWLGVALRLADKLGLHAA